MNARDDAPPVTLEGVTEPAAAARSQIYQLFVEAFTYPRGAIALRLLEGDWYGELQVAAAGSGCDIDLTGALDIPGDRHAVEALEQQYSALFDVPGGAPKVSLLERSYSSAAEQTLWQELLGFYRHFGLDFSQGYAEEQPDHLLTELAFMHYLCFLEAGARTGKDNFCRGQRDFLAIHLATWVEPLAARLDEQASASVYRQLGDWLVAFIGSDQRRLAAN